MTSTDWADVWFAGIMALVLITGMVLSYFSERADRKRDR